ncbi:MAG: ABC transporter substrate-binding protein [Chitinophagales bacterium]|nr:ABC transporter substrate-binding protein [Chitinophagales bacterium]
MRYINYLLILIFSFSLVSCGGSSSSSRKNDDGQLSKLNGNRYQGGVFRFNETEYFRSLYPLNITEVVGHRIANQIYEGLVIFDQDNLDIIPALAESWEVSNDATLYTFKIRKGVRFHDDKCFDDGKGREVTAHDFKYCFDRTCEADVNNQGFWIFKDLVKGANAYNKETAKGNKPEGGVSGIRVIDDYTLQVELERPFAVFLSRLALTFAYVYPKEAVEEYGMELRDYAVGTGPFKLKIVSPDISVVLIKNENYWGTDDAENALPYLDGIKVTFIKEEKVELLDFKQGNLDLKYRLPLELITEIIDLEGNLKPGYDKFTLQEAVEMSVQYYGFLMPHEVFGNIDVRKAFNYALDRQKIVDYTLKGQGIPAYHGIVPAAFDSYPFDKVEGYKYDPSKARAHLAKAGYPDGVGFPPSVLQINSGGGRNEQIAEAIQKMLQETLNIDISINQVVWAQHTETVETAKVGFWRLGWVADYPDPENFLNLLYSIHVPESLKDKAYINSFRYVSPAYDKAFEEAIRTLDKAERYEKYAEADQIAMKDAVILPIYYSKNNRLLNPRVRNFPQNPMEYRNFRDVYFVPEDEADAIAKK